MRRSTVLSLPLQSVFHAYTIAYNAAVNITILLTPGLKNYKGVKIFAMYKRSSLLYSLSVTK
jgi:hypothetical protein